MDHLGPIYPTQKGYNHLFVIIDAFTKFVWIYPVKTLTTKETLKKLELHRNHFTNPRRFITDRGTAFTSASFTEYCNEQEIELHQITTGIPRANGQVERINEIIISVLSKLTLGDESSWYKHVNAVQNALNSTYQRSIGTTPFEVLFGVKMNQKK